MQRRSRSQREEAELSASHCWEEDQIGSGAEIRDLKVPSLVIQWDGGTLQTTEASVIILSDHDGCVRHLINAIHIHSFSPSGCNLVPSHH